MTRPRPTLGEVAALVGGRVLGDPSPQVGDLVPLEQAGPDELGFLADRRYLKQLPDPGAVRLLVSESLVALLPEGEWSGVAVREPHQALAVLVSHLHPVFETPPGIHPTAVLGRRVRLGAGVHIGPYVVLEDGAEVGDRCVLGPHVVVGRDARVGAGSILHPHVVLYPGTVLGERVILHSGARVGVDGFGYVFRDGAHHKVPQVGACVVEDDVEVGANVCIDRGSIGRTVIGAGSKLDNLVHVGHNVRIGPGVLLVAQVGIAGSSRVGAGAVLGGQAGVSGHLDIGAGARLGAQAGVIGDVAPGETVSGYPARPHREYLQAMAALFRLPGSQRATDQRVRALEARLEALEAALQGEGPGRQR
jgi:UDP-3-O-[3-hydroxymyristoyl] glucosamine N-acyltransferase